VDRVAVLASGGLDSAVLLVALAEQAEVLPVYVESGLAWEREEQQALRSFLRAVARPRIASLNVLELPLRSIYGAHWGITGEGVPDGAAPDSAVYLPGRNVLLIGLTAVWCSLRAVTKIAIGSLDENPFPDATPEFFERYARLLGDAVARPIEVVAPFRGRHKWEIIARHAELPLELTLTCMAPRGGVHCGACNKCRERCDAFRKAGVLDRARYAATATT
jgi:7-cyano-7-deazaguanine synthase